MSASLTWVAGANHNAIGLAMASVDSLRNLTESELVEQFRATRSNICFEELYRRERRKVFGICLKYLRRVGEAEDAVHETFLRSYERFSTLEGSNFSGWVCRIAANFCLNQLRDSIRRQRARAERLPSEPDQAEDPAIRSSELDVTWKLMQALRPEHRKVLLLKYVEGFTYQEIEALTGYTNDQVRSYLQNGRRNFQILWEKLALSEGRGPHG